MIIKIGYLMTCLSSNQQWNNQVVNQTSKLGLEEDHAYSILDVRQVGLKRLVRLRNPWGKKERNSSFDDNWIKRSKGLKEKCLTSSENNGTFWIRMY